MRTSGRPGLSVAKVLAVTALFILIMLAIFCFWPRSTVPLSSHDGSIESVTTHNSGGTLAFGVSSTYHGIRDFQMLLKNLADGGVVQIWSACGGQDGAAFAIDASGDSSSDI